MEHDEQPRKESPSHFTVHERKGRDGETYGTKVGYGYRKKEGPGVELTPELLPLNGGKVVLYTAEEYEEIKRNRHLKQERERGGRDR